jgi:hypothetical protein
VRTRLLSGVNMLPGHLRPWAKLLGDNWPASAGTMPDERAVDMTLKWVRPGEVGNGRCNLAHAALATRRKVRLRR